jgi:hypothetical protein
VSVTKPLQPQPATQDELEAPTAKREIPPELREEASPKTPRGRATLRLDQADIDQLVKEKSESAEDCKTLPTPDEDP